LASSHDGQHWGRDQTPYFEPDPDETAWDHAHVWMDYQTAAELNALLPSILDSEFRGE